MKLTKYIGEQFGKPTGIGGKLSTFIMNRMNQRQYRGVIHALALSNQDKVLDIGFGNGYLIRKLAKQSEAAIWGIEISNDNIKAAGKRNAAYIAKGQVQLAIGDVVGMSFPDGFFDKVYTVNTIYFWSDLDKGLSEIRRVLKNGGIFANAVYAKGFLDKWRYTQYGFAKYTIEELKAASVRNGFSVIDVIQAKTDAFVLILK